MNCVGMNRLPKQRREMRLCQPWAEQLATRVADPLLPSDDSGSSRSTLIMGFGTWLADESSQRLVMGAASSKKQRFKNVAITIGRKGDSTKKENSKEQKPFHLPWRGCEHTKRHYGRDRSGTR
jgi:hypothetical protein